MVFANGYYISNSFSFVSLSQLFLIRKKKINIIQLNFFILNNFQLDLPLSKKTSIPRKKRENHFDFQLNFGAGFCT